MDSSELGGTEYKERHTPLNVKPDDLGRFPTRYIQMYHTQHVEHVTLEENSDRANLSKRKQNLKKKKKKEI